MIPYSVDFFVTHYRLSLFLTSFTCISLGIFIFIKNARNTVNRLFAIFMVSAAWWSGTQALIGTWPDYSAWLRIAQLEHFGHVWIPSVFLHFVHAISEIHKPRRLLVSYLISAAFFCLVPTRLFISHINVHAVAKFAVEGGPIYPLYMTWFVGTVVEALVKLRWTIRRCSQPFDRLKFKYIFWATAIGYSGGLPNFLYVFGINAYPIIPFCTYLVPVYPIVIAYAIVRHQALDIKVVIKKSLVYSVLAGVITAIYFCMVLVAEKLLQGVVGYRSLVGSVIAGFAIALGFTPLKEVVQRVVDQFFFRGSVGALAQENERLRHEVTRAERLKAVGTLAAGMAHEIKNPLAAIKTFTEFLPERYDNAEFREKFHRIVGGEVNRINHLVQRLLEFARPSAPQLALVQASEVMRETLECLQAITVQKRIRVETAFSEPDHIQADREQLKQAFLNLLLNGIEAMQPGGALNVTIRPRHGFVEILIEDTGPGIPQEILPRVFDPFYTTKDHGTGLGLSIVHTIVTEHGGHIALEGSPGRGTQVTLKFPLVSSPDALKPLAQPANMSTNGTG